MTAGRVYAVLAGGQAGGWVPARQAGRGATEVVVDWDCFCALPAAGAHGSTVLLCFRVPACVVFGDDAVQGQALLPQLQDECSSVAMALSTHTVPGGSVVGASCPCLCQMQHDT